MTILPDHEASAKWKSQASVQSSNAHLSLDNEILFWHFQPEKEPKKFFDIFHSVNNLVLVLENLFESSELIWNDVVCSFFSLGSHPYSGAYRIVTEPQGSHDPWKLEKVNLNSRGSSKIIQNRKQLSEYSNSNDKTNFSIANYLNQALWLCIINDPKIYLSWHCKLCRLNVSRGFSNTHVVTFGCTSVIQIKSLDNFRRISSTRISSIRPCHL